MENLTKATCLKESIQRLIMESKFVKYTPSANWSGYTLVFSCVSVGNIGQLAMDLLVSTTLASFKAKRVGHLITPLVLPVVGQDPFSDTANISLSCERKLLLVYTLHRSLNQISLLT